MVKPLISVSGVSKVYGQHTPLSARITGLFGGNRSSHLPGIQALDGVDLQVNRGDSVAIIGRNGSGKSTLLEIIAGTVRPTSGVVAVDGKIAALLELGSGFNPAYSGHDNIYLSAMLYGLTRADIDRKYDEIVSFAEIGDVLDRPVRTYSSGMLVRLAFSVQVALDPEVLIVDEALSVGDYFFQQKCFARIRKMQDAGLTLLFVSHDMGLIRDICQTALYLRNGRTEFYGDSKIAIQRYLSESTVQLAPLQDVEPNPIADMAVPGITESTLQDFNASALWTVETPESHSHPRLLALRLLDSSGNPATRFTLGSRFRLQVLLNIPATDTGHVSFVLKNRFDQVVTNNGTYLSEFGEISTGENQIKTIEFELHAVVEAGLYSLMVTFSRATAANQGAILEDTGWLGPLEIVWDYELNPAPFLGQFGLPCTVRLLPCVATGSGLGRQEIVENSILHSGRQAGTGELELLGAAVLNRFGEHTLSIALGDELHFYILARARRRIEQPYFGIAIYDSRETLIFTGTTLQKGDYCKSLAENDEIMVGFRVRFTVQAGLYQFRLSGAEPSVPYHPNKGTTLGSFERLGPITVNFDYERERAPFYGLSQLDMESL